MKILAIVVFIEALCLIGMAAVLIMLVERYRALINIIREQKSIIERCMKTAEIFELISDSDKKQFIRMENLLERQKLNQESMTTKVHRMNSRIENLYGYPDCK